MNLLIRNMIGIIMISEKIPINLRKLSTLSYENKEFIQTSLRSDKDFLLRKQISLYKT